VDELYRMLGKEHEGDLEREALKRQRAAAIGEQRAGEPEATLGDQTGNDVPPLLSRIAAALWRSARAES
jgi:hypothetical protein